MDIADFAGALLGDVVDIRGKLIPGFLILANIFAIIELSKQERPPAVIKFVNNHSFLLIFFVIFVSQILGGAALKVSFVTLSEFWQKPGPVEFFENDKNPKLLEFYKSEYEGYEEPDEELFDHAKETIAYNADNKRAIQLEARANFAAGLVIPLLLSIITAILFFRTIASKVLAIGTIIFVLAMYITDFKKVVTYSEPKSIYTRYYELKQNISSTETKSSRALKSQKP